MNWQNIKIYIIVGILIVGVSASIYFLINEVSKSSQELSTKRKLFLADEQKLNSMTGTQQKYEEKKKDLEKINTLFISDPTNPTGFMGFLREIEPILKTKNIKPETIKNPPALSFTFSFDNSLPNILRFIDKIENGPYAIEIVSLNIQGKGQDASPNVSAKFKITVLSK